MKDETMELIHVPGGADDPLLTAAEYARRRGVSEASVSKMRKRHGVKLDGNRRAPLSAWEAAREVGAAMDKNAADARAVGGEKGIAATHAKLRTKKLALEIEAQEMANAVKRGEYIPRATAEKMLSGAFQLFNLLIEEGCLDEAAERRDTAFFERMMGKMDNLRRRYADVFERAADANA